MNPMLLTLLLLATTCLAGGEFHAVFDETKVPPYALPELLRLDNGEPVRDAAGWARRRSELIDRFSTTIYGRTPATHLPIRRGPVEEARDALGGLAIRRQFSLVIGPDGGPRIDVLVYLPARAVGPVPAFLGLNFDGNQSVHADPGIHLCASWQEADEKAGIVDHRATDRTRGIRAQQWQVEKILASGFALVTASYSDIVPDDAGQRARGIQPLFYGDSQPADGMGAIGAWAWGMSRILDHLDAAVGVDPTRVATFGHSRLGKAAVWAAAQDERFAMAVSNNSGCFGAALTRRVFGEQIHHITTAFPHWFVRSVAGYADRDGEFPLEQHEFLALIAPRPLYVGSGADDAWADPQGEFLSTLNASPAWELLGHPGLGITRMPGVDLPVQGGLAYHRRSGGHKVTAWDWERYLEYADRMLKGPR